MVVLKKIKATTLMETLVATVLLVVIFMLASLILNNLFSNTIKSNTDAIDNYLNELEYLYLNEEIGVPFYDDFKNWKINMQYGKEAGQKVVLLEAVNINSNQTIERHLTKQ